MHAFMFGRSTFRCIYVINFSCEYYFSLEVIRCRLKSSYKNIPVYKIPDPSLVAKVLCFETVLTCYSDTFNGLCTQTKLILLFYVKRKVFQRFPVFQISNRCCPTTINKNENTYNYEFLKSNLAKGVLSRVSECSFRCSH